MEGAEHWNLRAKQSARRLVGKKEIWEGWPLFSYSKKSNKKTPPAGALWLMQRKQIKVLQDLCSSSPCGGFPLRV